MKTYGFWSFSILLIPKWLKTGFELLLNQFWTGFELLLNHSHPCYICMFDGCLLELPSGPLCALKAVGNRFRTCFTPSEPVLNLFRTWCIPVECWFPCWIVAWEEVGFVAVVLPPTNLAGRPRSGPPHAVGSTAANRLPSSFWAPSWIFSPNRGF